MADLSETIISCDLLRVKTYSSETGEALYFGELNNILGKIDIADSEATISKDRVKIYKKEHHTKDNLWEIQILRFRDKILPGIETIETGEYELIKVNDGESLAEFNTIIYDPKNHCIIMHRNRNALSPSGLQIYLNELIKLEKDSKKILLEPIIKNFNRKKFSKNKQVIFRKLEFSIDISDISSNSVLGSLIQIGETNGHRFRGVISMANTKKDNTLDLNLLEKIIDSNIEDDKWKTLKIGIRENLNSELEMFDLIQNKMSIAEEFTYSAENPIDHGQIFSFFKKDYIRNYREEKPILIK